MKKCIWIFGISICLLLFFFWQNNALVTSRYVFETDKIGEDLDGYRIVQISDLHNKRFGKNQKRLLEKIKVCNPDLIVVTGDIHIHFFIRFLWECPAIRYSSLLIF